jgi:hypothetical protein
MGIIGPGAPGEETQMWSCQENGKKKKRKKLN